MATLKDIATQANVSVTTVSDVLNGKSKQRRVSVEVTDLVKKIAKELKYQSHVHGRALALQKTFLVGLVVESIHTSFWGELVAKFLEKMEKEGYRVLLYYTHGDLDSAREAYQDLIARNVDGIAFLGGQIPRDSMITPQCPVVISHQALEGVSSVSIDQEYGVKLAVDHLLSMGHDDILVLGQNSQRDQMALAYLHHLGKNGFAVTLERLLEKMNQPYTACFATCDELAVRAMGLLQNRGFVIPNDFSIIGFDNLNMAEWMTPGLSSVDQCKLTYGLHVAETLVGEMKKEKKNRLSNELILKPQLVVRGSVKKRR